MPARVDFIVGSRLYLPIWRSARPNAALHHHAARHCRLSLARGHRYAAAERFGGDFGMSVQSSAGGRGSVVVGIGLAVLAYLLFSLQDATIKWLAAGFTAPQILLMRSVVIV